MLAHLARNNVFGEVRDLNLESTVSGQPSVPYAELLNKTVENSEEPVIPSRRVKDLHTSSLGIGHGWQDPSVERQTGEWHAGKCCGSGFTFRSTERRLNWQPAAYNIALRNSAGVPFSPARSVWGSTNSGI